MTTPTLTSSEDLLGLLYSAALTNTLVTNGVPDPTRSADILRADGGYAAPWTRDAAINAWNGVNLVKPELAEAILQTTTEPGLDYTLLITEDNQQWGQVTWLLQLGVHN